MWLCSLIVRLGCHNYLDRIRDFPKITVVCDCWKILTIGKTDKSGQIFDREKFANPQVYNPWKSDATHLPCVQQGHDLTLA